MSKAFRHSYHSRRRPGHSILPLGFFVLLAMSFFFLVPMVHAVLPADEIVEIRDPVSPDMSDLVPPESNPPEGQKEPTILFPTSTIRGKAADRWTSDALGTPASCPVSHRLPSLNNR